jgi:cellulose synthase/poly-beta-1,6-N-acetylglucosamine synthase-like glycosyltransferase
MSGRKIEDIPSSATERKRWAQGLYQASALYHQVSCITVMQISIDKFLAEFNLLKLTPKELKSYEALVCV